MACLASGRIYCRPYRFWCLLVQLVIGMLEPRRRPAPKWSYGKSVADWKQTSPNSTGLWQALPAYVTLYVDGTCPVSRGKTGFDH